MALTPLVLVLAGLAARGAPAAPEATPPAGGPSYGVEEPLPPTALEREAIAAVRARLGARSIVSPALSRAARELAERAAAGDREALGRPELRLALARAAASDPAPTVLVVSGPTHLLATQLAAAGGAGDFTHLGVGAAETGSSGHAVLLLSRRTAELEPMRRDLLAGSTAELRGRLLGLSDPRVFATGPDGRARAVRTSASGGGFLARLGLHQAGRFVVEVVGSGRGGPEVAALLVLSAGGAPLAEPRRDPPPEPADPALAEARVVGAINALRARHGLPALESSDRLRELARGHSAAMLAASTLAHVLRDGEALGGRLRRARIPFRRALENLAKGSGAMAAQVSIEESPAHLDNLLDPAVTALGVGIARARLPTGEPIVYLTQVLVQPVDDSSDSRLRPEERVRVALWQERERLRLSPLLADPALDALAGRAAREMLRAGEPDAGDAAAQALRLPRRVAATDVFVAASPADAVRSANLANPGLRRVGVGVAIGDSPAFGAGLLWIAVVYTE